MLPLAKCEEKIFLAQKKYHLAKTSGKKKKSPLKKLAPKYHLRWKVTKLNNRVRGQKNIPPEYSVFWENVSVFSLCVIINPSFSRHHEMGMVLVFLTSSNSRLKCIFLAIIYKRIGRLKWSLHRNVCLGKSYWFLQDWSCKYAHETFDRQKAWIWTYVKFVQFLPLRQNCSKSRQKTLSVF